MNNTLQKSLSHPLCLHILKMGNMPNDLLKCEKNK